MDDGATAQVVALSLHNGIDFHLNHQKSSKPRQIPSPLFSNTLTSDDVEVCETLTSDDVEVCEVDTGLSVSSVSFVVAKPTRDSVR